MLFFNIVSLFKPKSKAKSKRKKTCTNKLYPLSLGVFLLSDLHPPYTKVVHSRSIVSEELCMEQGNITIAPAQGKLGVLLPGMGAVSTTLIAGVELVKQGLGRPVGSLTQYGTIRLGKRTENNQPLIKDFVPLADLNDLVFG